MSRPGLAFATLLLVLGTAGGASSTPTLPLETCTLAGGIEARCGTLRVPEDRSRPDDRTIGIRVAVVPARGGVAQPDPLVYITGGPGGSAIQAAGGIVSIFTELNAGREIVLVDQRGTGGSGRLECVLPRTPPRTPAGVTAYVRGCVAGLEADPRQYTTAPAMDDLAEVIRALGYEAVDLYGTSYGATAAQYFLAQHPDLVRSAVLDGGTLLDIPIFERWAPNSARALRLVLDRCARAPRCGRAFPRVRSEVFEMIAGLRRKPVTAQGVRIDAPTAAGAIHALLLSPGEAAQIPWIAHRARSGDWLPLVLALDRLGDGAPAPRQVTFWSIVCNEPWARWRPERVAAASAGTYLAERATTNARFVAAVCAGVPRSKQPTWSAARVRSAAPVLFVVGQADPQDPVANIAGARRELPNSRVVVVPAAGHVSAQLGCMPRIVTQFVERGTAVGLDTSCVAGYTPPRFVVR